MILTRGQGQSWLQFFGGAPITDLADAGSAGQSYNQALQRWDTSIDGEPWNTLTSIFTHRRLRVDGFDGDDALADENIARPYKTLQAAINYALSKPDMWNIALGPGHFDEAIVIDPGANSGTLVIEGMKGESSIASLMINHPSDAMAAMTVAVLEVSIRNNIPSVIRPLDIIDGLGGLAVVVKGGDIAVTSNAVDTIAVDASGHCFLRLDECNVMAEMGATGGRGIVATGAYVDLRDTPVQADGAVAVELVDSNISLWNSDIYARSPGFHGVTLAGNGSLQVIFGGVEIAGTGGAECIYSLSPNVMALVALGMLQDDTIGIGNIYVPNGQVIAAMPVTPPGHAHPGITAAAVARLLSAWHSSYDNTATGMTAENAQDAIDEVATTTHLARGGILTPLGSPHFVPLTVGLVRVDVTTGPVTIVLQPAAGFGTRTLTVKHEAGDIATNNITLDVHGAETIEGAGSYAMTLPGSSATMYGDGASKYFLI